LFSQSDNRLVKGGDFNINLSSALWRADVKRNGIRPTTASNADHAKLGSKSPIGKLLLNAVTVAANSAPGGCQRRYCGGKSAVAAWHADGYLD